MHKVTLQYLHLRPESSLPDISGFSPFRSVVVIQESISAEWQSKVSAWLVQSGCLYMMAWGKECSSWDDAVDIANLEEFNFEEIPEEKFVMTTWHENETLKEAFWFAKNSALHPAVELRNTLILDISAVSREESFLAEYNYA